MPIDFTRRADQNPSDPSAVVSVTPKKVPYWIKTDPQGQWLGLPTNLPTAAKEPGYRSVGVGEVLLNDGRTYLAVLDGNGQPISEVGDSTGINTDQHTAFTQGVSQAGRTNTPGQRTYPGTDPQTGMPAMVTEYPNNPNKSYEPMTAAQMAQAGYHERSEGAPDPNSPTGYNSEHPVMVMHGPSGTVISTREMTDDERKAWNISRQMARNPGGLSDADLRAQQAQSVREPDKTHPGYSVVKTVNPQTGQTETHYEKDDTPGVSVPPPTDTPTPVQAPDKTWGVWKPNPSGGAPTWTPIAGPQAAPTAVEINGTYGVWKPDPNGGPPTFEPIKQQPGLEATPADAPNVDLSNPQRAYDSFMQLYQWASSKVARGEKTPQWLESVLQGPHTAVSTVLDREKEMTRRAENTQGNLLTQRNQDIGFADNRLSNATQGLQTATSAADKINSLAGPGLHAYSSTLLGTLALQGIQNQALGGTNALPASVIPGPVAGQPGAAMPGLPAGVPNAAAAQAEADRQRSMAAQGAVAAPVFAGATATNAAATDPSGANLQAATDATMAGSSGLFNPQPPTNVQPQGMAPIGAAPTMALAASMRGGNPYGYALDALRRLGIHPDAIDAAHQDFLNV